MITQSDLVERVPGGFMLRIRSYPELIGKALVLEADPFEAMVDDDEPWVEGLVLVVTVGLAVALAQIIGGLLLTATLPPADTMLNAILTGWREFNARLFLAPDTAAGEATIRQAWSWMQLASGYDSGWARLFTLIITPLGLIFQWVVASLLVYGLARAFGGHGTLNQTLGAVALIVAPQVLLLLHVVPFVAVSGLLLGAWGVLILYRAVEVAHDLPWERAALVALAPYLLLILFLVVGVTITGFLFRIGGGV
jgi:hypothetical protein